MCNTMLGPVFLLFFFYFVFFSSVIYKQIKKACRNNIDLRNTSEWDFVCLNWWNLLMLLISCDTLPASFTSFVLTPSLFDPPPSKPYARYTTSCNGWSTDPDRTMHAAHFSIVSHSALSPDTLFTMCLALFCAFWPLCW